MILVIDNYDSFVHNLTRYLRRLGVETLIKRNDQATVADVERLNPKAIVFSPGPCTPIEAGASLELVRAMYMRCPMLGVCLGHQIIAEALGGKIVSAAEPVHGRTWSIEHDGKGLFANLPNPLTVGRYHSLVVDPASLPPEIKVTATTNFGEIMAFAHHDQPVFGVQFHPESILTSHGYELLANFLQLAGIETNPNASGLKVGEILPTIRSMNSTKTLSPHPWGESSDV